MSTPPYAVGNPQPLRRNGHVRVPPNGDGWKVKAEGGGVDSSYAARDEPTRAWHRLSQAEQHVLRCFLAGRLPAGQVDAELARARSETSPVATMASCSPTDPTARSASATPSATTPAPIPG